MVALHISFRYALKTVEGSHYGTHYQGNTKKMSLFSFYSLENRKKSGHYFTNDLIKFLFLPFFTFHPCHHVLVSELGDCPQNPYWKILCRATSAWELCNAFQWKSISKEACLHVATSCPKYIFLLKFKTLRVFTHARAHAAALRAFASVPGTHMAAQAKHKSPRPVTRSFMRQR